MTSQGYSRLSESSFNSDETAPLQRDRPRQQEHLKSEDGGAKSKGSGANNFQRYNSQENIRPLLSLRIDNAGAIHFAQPTVNIPNLSNLAMDNSSININEVPQPNDDPYIHL